MNKKAKYTFGGANQDLTKSKHPGQYYYDAQHIKIISTTDQSTGSAANEKGTELVITIPTVNINKANSNITYAGKTLIYVSGKEIDKQIDAGTLPSVSTDQQIIGVTNTRTGLIVFTTDNLGMDCIWNIDNIVDDSYVLELIYVRNLNFSFDFPIQAIFNYENENIQKVYWVDGKEQIRFLNIKHEQIEGNENLIDIPSNSIDFVGSVDFSQPVVTSVVGGGTHTAGVIQYAYNLFRLNSSQTKISPLSDLVPLGKGLNLGGGEVNEVVAATPIVKISDIDPGYTNIRVYAIKYTSYNQIPSISLIDEREITGTEVTIYDDGSTISSLAIEEFLLLGSEPYIPKHIESKDNRLILANIQSKAFLLPEELDCRAYGHSSFGSSLVFDDVRLINNGLTGNTYTVNTTTYNVPREIDAVNTNYNFYRYQKNGTTIGGEGKFLKYQLLQKTAGNLSQPVNKLKFFKDQEIYRIGIVFYNRLGQESLPQWIADFKAPEGNLLGNYNTLKVELKTEFYTWLNSFNFATADDKPVGYKVIRADRTLNDRTIIAQGITAGMMCNVPVDSRGANLVNATERKRLGDINPKIPNFLTRTFANISPLQANKHLLNMQFKVNNPNDTGTTGTENELTEIQYDQGDDRQRQVDAFQYTAMYQMYSPDIFFENLPLSANLRAVVKGGAINVNNYAWIQERNVNTKVAEIEAKVTGGLTPHAVSSSNVDRINGNSDFLMDRGLISNSNSGDEQRVADFIQWYRDFSGFKDASNNNYYQSVYGTPELTERGQGRTIYNNNAKYEYQNTLQGVLTDGEGRFKNDQLGLISLNTHGSRCLTFVLGSPDDIDSASRPKMEQLYSGAGVNQTNTALIIELTKSPNDVYLSNIYGGNSFEDKKRTVYLQIGSYNDIALTSVQIDSPGDTFVQDFQFMRLAKTDTEVYQYNINQVTEIIRCKVESTVDSSNRNDISISTWDSRFNPRYDEYHQYNRVYSQQPTLVKSTDVEATNRVIKNFDTRIQSTKLKIPNESVDSWTDILVNETMDLNGKFGPINNLIEFKDNLYAFQDEAIAGLSINPRVQVQGNDGVGIELGTGGILYDFNYLTTKSGSINKWGIASTKRGIYYYDALNKGVGRVPDAVTPLLSDAKGLHTFFNNNYNYDLIKEDNPILAKGAVIGYDNYNNDVYITLLQGDKSFTWLYNELADTFIDRKLYLPSKYIYKGEKLIGISPDNKNLYEHYKGQYNNYYGQNHSSFVTFQLNPESDLDSVFNNVFFNSELYLNDIDQPDKTLTHIRAFNEYQDSGRIPLVVGRSTNLRRKFREWKAEIPRMNRNRIRNPWIYLTLEIENTSDYKFILHDIIINYSV